MQGRIRGEELAILLPEIGQAEAIAVAERLRRCVESQALRSRRSAAVSLTVSVGVGSLGKRETLD